MDHPELYTATRRVVLAGLGAAGVGAVTDSNATANESADEQDEEDEDDGPGPGQSGFPPVALTEWGEPMDLGDGEVTSFVSLNSADMPLLVGLHLTGDALDGLGDREHVSLAFPDDVEETAFQWIGLHWAQAGHGPPGVYDVPHFDIHFYLLAEDEVREIPPINFPPGQSDDEPYSEPIPEDQFPPNYVRDHLVVPEMGEHLLDVTAPESSGEEFTNTFVWGHWDGNLHFFEPMVTREYLENLAQGEGRPFQGSQDTRRITMPERMPEAGRYPTEYTVRYHDDEDAYTVTLELFRPFEASG